MKRAANFSTYIKIINVFKYIFFGILFYIFARAGINGKVFVFAFGLFFGLVWCNQSILILSPLFVLATYLATLNLYSTLASLFSAIVILLAYGIHKKIRKPIKPVLYIIYGLLALAPKVFLDIYFGGNIIIAFVGTILALLFAMSSMHLFSAIFVKGISHKLTSTEILCGAVFIILLGCGLCGINIGSFSVIKLVVALTTLVSTYLFSVPISVVLSALFGTGTLLLTSNAVLIAPFIIWALAIGIFKVRNKYFSIVALIATEALIGYALNLYYSFSYMSLLPVVLASIAFILIPEAILNAIAGLFELTKDKNAMRSVVNRSRENLCRRFAELSEVFAEMDKVFRSMIKGGLSTDEAKSMLVNEIKSNICGDCSERNRCHRAFTSETESIFEDLISYALSRGKTTLLDIPPFLTARCSKLSVLVAYINQITEQYKNYAGIISNVDTSKVLIADQLCGVSKIMKSLSLEVSKNVTFDTVREDKIIEELAFYNIICTDCVIYEQNIDIVSCTLVVRDEDAMCEKIPKIVSKFCGNEMMLASSVPSQKANYSVLNLKTACKYDVIFGTASTKKASSKVSGDCFSLLRIESDKFLLALCDGMGSGEKAQKTSSLAIGLVENFYKAGFDNEIILSSVNKLLSLNSNDNFSALDIALIDLRRGTCDHIKLGAPESFIKHSETTDIIESGALPLGIVSEIKPWTKKSMLITSDMIVLVSDGIADAFNSPESLCAYINNVSTLNPQTLADAILERAIFLSGEGGPCDDMTVAITRIIER